MNICQTRDGHLCNLPWKSEEGNDFLTGCVAYKDNLFYCALGIYAKTSRYTNWSTFKYGWDWCVGNCTVVGKVTNY